MDASISYEMLTLVANNHRVESRKVVRTYLFLQSLTMSCRLDCEHTLVVAKLPVKMGELIDSLAKLAGLQAHP